MKTKLALIWLAVLLAGVSCAARLSQDIRYGSVNLSAEEKQIVQKYLVKWSERYSAEECMLTATLDGWNYHTDAQSGEYHEVRSSITYASALLDVGGNENSERAIRIIDKVISLQDTVTGSRFRGVWPYYQEEPLAIKKSPVDSNWADFICVRLIDVWLGHKKEIPDSLLCRMKNAMVLAAEAIMRRDVKPDYTNIAIMGSYVTYVVSHLFDIELMKDYSLGKIKTFYNYTLDKDGFSEYNSPTYTITALNELERMQRNISNKEVRSMVDSLYAIGWNIIASHYHAPTGQWVGPHSRAYSSQVRPSFYGLLNKASGGKIDMGHRYESSDMKVKHKIPYYLEGSFLAPVYPRIQKDIYENVSPKIIGTAYLNEVYALSSANRSSLWNQRRPLLLYWGDKEKPHYLQLRMLHDGYDFSSASFYSQQIDNKVLAGVNFVLGGGDKHISLDRLQNGEFTAKDLRLRFEIGNKPNYKKYELPSGIQGNVNLYLNNISVRIKMFHASFDNSTGYWEKGGDDNNSWIDYVIYSGKEKGFSLAEMENAVYGFILAVNEDSLSAVDAYVSSGRLYARWNDMQIDLAVKPEKLPANL